MTITDELALAREACKEWQREAAILLCQRDAARTEAEEWRFLVNELKARIKDLEANR